MTIIDFVRLILKHLLLLLLVPIVLASLVVFLTRNPSFEYSSQTVLYTGIATGSSIEMDKTFNYQASNAAFDNLINIINSRETQEEVAIRLLAQHLMLPKANPKYISKTFYDQLRSKIPSSLYKYVVRKNKPSPSLIDISDPDEALFPPEINRADYEKTVKNLMKLMKSSNSNYVYELLNYGKDDHYSLKAIAKITAVRISNSDLIKLSYTVNDPGICQQTLAIYNLVCIVNYKHVKENRSDAVVKYFEAQLENARQKLSAAEDILLEFNKSSNIINYYEQSKAVAIVKEDMDVDYNKKIADLAGIEASTIRLKEKLKIQEAIQQKTAAILEKKKQYGDLNYKMALIKARFESINNEDDLAKIAELNEKAEALSNDIKRNVAELYSYQNSIDGLPVSKILPDWMNNVVEAENIKAKIKVINGQNKDFQIKYANYAPAGATIKRIEREISVSEQGYLDILHGLNLAKLKLQDSELTSNLKAVDTPYYPLSPNPTKRTLLIIATAVLGGILMLAIIFIMEYFDDTLKNAKIASKKLGMNSLGMMPKLIKDPKSINLSYIKIRLIEIITQNVLYYFEKHPSDKKTKTIVVYSTQKQEGKTVIAGNIAKTLKSAGKKVVMLTYEGAAKPIKNNMRFSALSKFLGYADPRIDYANPFLAAVSSYLDASEYHTYAMNNTFHNAQGFTDIVDNNNITLDFVPDFVIIELPSLIDHITPIELINKADLKILVCRSNRVWSEADQSAIKNIVEAPDSKNNFIINGVAINEVEAVLGELPKQRSLLRRKLKAMFKFQFFTRNHI
jgi:succinoglycan biosynthesis transport protein ExoP